ncbi:efflux RND transporter periplasmic adaptor subunit [Aquabacterium sp. A7-Y]|uniref:HlyD family secretion protein n=1 Tax=Aquabacterium sp. A7-Y TaxID=1349605 RepID=UPI00223DC790|nr:efflux RND transporter periplasmic adaptor subunit [Aquabacterium sp. A7-Y]MCW7539462.1 efflux RND transporter periplasmic adaptor subunit [Aquabacterium sp. A7-Y]
MQTLRTPSASDPPGFPALRIALLLLALCGLTACEEKTAEGPPDSPQQAEQLSRAAVASAKGRVDLDGGIIRLSASQDGVIASVHVEEGARVKAGQVLARLDDTLAIRQLALADREAAQARQELKKAEVERQAAAREVNRLQAIAQDDTVPRQDLDRARDAHLLAVIAEQAARAAIDTAQARAAVAAREVEERRIIAPLDGQIIQRQVRPGHGVSTLNLTPLFLFAPDEARIVRAELEEQYLAAVKPGQNTEIVLEADPSRRWQGKVVRLGKVVGQRTPSEDPAERQDSRVVEAVIALDTKELLIGQRVIVRFFKT